MDTINRSALVVKPKKPFLDWLKFVDKDLQEMTLNDLQNDVPAYLLPDFEKPEDLDKYIKGHFKLFFEEALSSWFTDETIWPKKRDWNTFQEWFDVESHSIVMDLGDGEIEKEED